MNRTEYVSELIALISSIKRSLHSQRYSCEGGSLTSGQLGLLFAIKHHGPLSAHDLAKRLTLSAGAVSQLVETLSDRSFILKATDEQDRRVQHLSLSPTGIEVLARIEKERYALLAAATDSLTEAELQLLIHAHQKMLESIQNTIIKPHKETE